MPIKIHRVKLFRAMGSATKYLFAYTLISDKPMCVYVSVLARLGPMQWAHTSTTYLTMRSLNAIFEFLSCSF